MSKPMSEQMQKLAARYEKATGEEVLWENKRTENLMHER